MTVAVDSRATMRRGMLALLTAAVLWVWPAPAAHAHDLGSTVVDVVLAPDGRLVATIAVDPETLLRRLQLEGGEPEQIPTALSDLHAAIRARERVFLSSVVVEADGRPVQLTFALETGDVPLFADPVPPAVVRLEGVLPAQATRFTWRYDLPLGSYALRVRQLAGTAGGADLTPATPGTPSPEVTVPPGSAPPAPGDPAADAAQWQVQWLMGGRVSEPVEWSGANRLAWQVARDYLELGFVHILPRGLDHILFVLSLFLLSRAWRPLLLQVSAFTLAHSVTLALSVLGVARLPAGVVEPLIAASIAWVAAENLFRSSLTRTRLAVVFGFGLLHGFGFAGVLSGLGLPKGSLLVALAAFNVGVELGQLTVLGAAASVTAWVVWQSPGTYRRWVVVPGSSAIALVGAFWTVQRIISP